MNAVRRSVTDGHLLTPTGASALDLLGENNSWTAERLQLTTEVRDAVIVAFEASLGDGNLARSEELAKAAADLGAETGVVNKMMASLERGYLDAEQKRVSPMSDMVQTQRASPRFPNRALNRGLSGWVEVFFTVTPNGDTADISVRASEPGDVFDNAAIKAVGKWKFEPFEYRGQIISKRVGTKLVFNLED
jgi:TonB family protein